MSTPYGYQPGEAGGPDPFRPGQQPGQRGTRAPDEDIPRQGGYRDDAYGQGAYSAYPQSAAGYADGAQYARSYLQGAPVGFADAVRGAFGHLLTLRGRASRSAFWWFALLAVIVYGAVGYVSGRSTVAGAILDIIVGIPFILASISLAVRRLHDSDKSGWWWWIGFVPFIGGLVLLVMYLLPSTRGPNRFNFGR